MSKTLKLIDHLFARGCRLHELCRNNDAFPILQRLSRFQKLPSEVAEQTQVRLAEIYLARKQFRAARRCLTVALRHAPLNARYHYLMAVAIESDEHGDPARAMSCYRRSLKLGPDQIDCLCDGGLLAIRLGQIEEGLTYLRRAAELSPDDIDTLECLVKGLLSAECPNEARAAVRAAMFRNPRDSRFRKVWNDLQFQMLSEAQAAAKAQTQAAQDDRPVLLPFIRPVAAESRNQPFDKDMRWDRPAPLLPRPYRPTRRPDTKHAP